MPYKLSGREVVMILSAICKHYSHITDSLCDPSLPFPVKTLEHWRRSGAVAREVSPSFFIYYDRNGQNHPFNLFVFGRLHNAIDKGGNTYEEIFETAVYAPLLKPNTFAMRVAEMNTKDYLMAMGGDNLLHHYFTIFDMLLAYHRHDLHPLVITTGKFDTRKTVTSSDAFASELYHRIGASYDWQAIAHFLVYDTKYQGAGMDILSKYGNVRVYRSVKKATCEGCRALYMDNDKPKLFSINDLLYNGLTTIAERVKDEPATIPTCGPSHQWCNCSEPFKLTGMEWWFEEEPLPKPQNTKDLTETCPAEADRLTTLVRGFFAAFRK